MSIETIKRDEYGYKPARLASRIAVIGSYALYLANNVLAKECADRLVEFDSTYLKESPKPHDRRHIKEMQETYRQLEVGDHYFSESYGSLSEKISQTALDKFRELYETIRRNGLKR